VSADATLVQKTSKNISLGMVFLPGVCRLLAFMQRLIQVGYHCRFHNAPAGIFSELAPDLSDLLSK
jgi:hypothetical protein